MHYSFLCQLQFRPDCDRVRPADRQLRKTAAHAETEWQTAFGVLHRSGG